MEPLFTYLILLNVFLHAWEYYHTYRKEGAKLVLPARIFGCSSAVSGFACGSFVKRGAGDANTLANHIPRYESSTAVEADIREKAGKLEQFYDHIMSCQVVVEAPHSHHHKGNLYQVRIDMTVPDGELLVSHGHHHQDHSHEDVYVAIRDAFDAMKRQLEDYARKRRGDVKHHVMD